MIAGGYFSIGTIIGRYSWRYAKRQIAKGRKNWNEGPGDFFMGFFWWPIYSYTLLEDASRENGHSIAERFLCAREPKQIRRREKLKQLKAQNDEAEKELLDAV
jgi:hypothetical protein